MVVKVQEQARAQDLSELAPAPKFLVSELNFVGAVNAKSSFGNRLQALHEVTATWESSLVISFQESKGESTAWATWNDGRKDSTKIDIARTDGVPLDLEALENRALSLSVAQFRDTSQVQFRGGHHHITVPSDPDYHSNDIEAVLQSHAQLGDQRFIIVKKDGKFHDYQYSARVIDITKSDEGVQLTLEQDNGRQFKLYDHEICGMYRAGKMHTLVNDAPYKAQEKFGENAVTQVVDFKQSVINDYFALYQKIDLTFVADRERTRRSETVTLTHLGVKAVPLYDSEGLPTGKTKEYIFGLKQGAGNQGKLYAIALSDVEQITGHVQEYASPVGGGSRTSSLGKIPAYTIGSKIYGNDPDLP